MRVDGRLAAREAILVARARIGGGGVRGDPAGGGCAGLPGVWLEGLLRRAVLGLGVLVVARRGLVQELRALSDAVLRARGAAVAACAGA